MMMLLNIPYTLYNMRILSISMGFVNIFSSITMNKLQCMLCTRPYNHPKMCPHCSQVFCHECITRYLADKYFCPDCDNYIIDLVNCERLIKEVNEMVVLRGKCHPKSTQFIGVDNEVYDPQNPQIDFNMKTSTCPYHKLELTYYCETCQMWICTDCGVIDSHHKDHAILGREQAQVIYRDAVMQKLAILEREIDKIQRKRERYVLDLEVYKSQIKWSKNKLYEYCEKLLKRAEAEVSQTTQQFQQLISQNQVVLKRLSTQRDQLNQILQNSCRKYILPFNLTDNAQESQQSMFEFHDAQPCKLQIMQHFRYLREEIFPCFTHFTFQFDYKNNLLEYYQYSEYFERLGQKWRVKVYPKGDSGAANKYLSIFLQLTEEHQNPPIKWNQSEMKEHFNLLKQSRKYVYRIELISLNRAGSTVVKESCSVFNTKDIRGYSNYLDLKDIGEYLHEGRLLFSIGIRNDNYAGLSDDLKSYIYKMHEENRVLQKLLCESNYNMIAHKQQNNCRSEQSSLRSSYSSLMINNSIDVSPISDIIDDDYRLSEGATWAKTKYDKIIYEGIPNHQFDSQYAREMNKQVKIEHEKSHECSVQILCGSTSL